MKPLLAPERRAIKVRGLVQGVGFRPFAYGAARRCGLNGFVRNETDGVLIEVEGAPASIDRFLTELANAPPRARIEDIETRRLEPRGAEGFSIEPSAAPGDGDALFSPDIATCDRCLSELRDPSDRRHRYPFLNCSWCGPRLTIVEGAPYDRSRTTMKGFPLCAACAREYGDPADRRHHAQPTACADCGPALRLRDRSGRLLPEGDALAAAARALLAGQVVAVKGVGGYHLACDARREDAVRRLRERKGRDEKPFAVMVAGAAAARALCELSAEEERLLESWRRPIVLLRRRAGAGLAESVAPGDPCLGVLLAYSPLHHELLAAAGGAPLVMTSGNVSDEPIAFEDADALSRLGGLADLFLTHDRPVRTRCDDSVARVVAGRALPLRRARGYAPEPIALPVPCGDPILALGGQLKASFALGRGRRAVLSHHLGDLDGLAAHAAFTDALSLYEKLFAFEPALLVHDLHPDYATTRYALERAERQGLRRLAVQHHHAHMASVMADNGLSEQVVGVCFDGSGYGADGTLWGGEFLIGDYTGFERAAHLRPVPLPGGEQAVRETWRMALSHLLDAGESLAPLEARIPSESLARVARLAAGGAAARTSSGGRLFDAVAALIGVRDRVSYEGQAAVALERLALGERTQGGYRFGLAPVGGSLVIDTRPVISGAAEDLRRGAAPASVARRFHTALVEMIAEVCARLRESSGLDAVALSGGVFANSILAAEVPERLRALGLRVYTHGQVPPNDGGLSLGQLAVAAARHGGRR